MLTPITHILSTNRILSIKECIQQKQIWTIITISTATLHREESQVQIIKIAMLPHPTNKMLKWIVVHYTTIMDILLIQILTVRTTLVLPTMLKSTITGLIIQSNIITESSRLILVVLKVKMKLLHRQWIMHAKHILGSFQLDYKIFLFTIIEKYFIFKLLMFHHLKSSYQNHDIILVVHVEHNILTLRQSNSLPN